MTREQIERVRNAKYPWAQLCKLMYALPEDQVLTVRLSHEYHLLRET